MMHIIPPINRIVKFFLSALTMILLCMPIQAQIDEWLQRLEKIIPDYPIYCDSDTITVKEYNQRIRDKEKAREGEGMSGAKFLGTIFGSIFAFSLLVSSIIIIGARREQRREAERERKSWKIRRKRLLKSFEIESSGWLQNKRNHSIMKNCHQMKRHFIS